MIVKFLKSSVSFAGINYNTDKIDKGKGELMNVSNFGPLQGLENLRPEDYRSYLKLISNQNDRVKNPQLHVVISCKGKEYDKHQLTDIGKQWLSDMGYGQNPYIVVFHKDTDNNHIHLVSTRIDKDGKKINHDFEGVRAAKVLNKILGIDPQITAKADIEKALSYKFTTKPQLSLIFEGMGYDVKHTNDGMQLYKYAEVQSLISNNEFDNNVSQVNDFKRIAQLRAIVEKYKLQYSATFYPKTLTLPSGLQKNIGFTSDLSNHLKDKFGLELVFHSKDDKPVYGYTILDHSGKNVFKGSDVIKLKELLKIDKEPLVSKMFIEPPYKTHIANRISSSDEVSYYKTLAHSSLTSYGNLQEGLRHQGFDLVNDNGKVLLIDTAGGCSIDLDLLIDKQTEAYSKFEDLSPDQNEPSVLQDISQFGLSGNDIDDEAINGRNRRKKGMARTNTR